MSNETFVRDHIQSVKDMLSRFAEAGREMELHALDHLVDFLIARRDAVKVEIEQDSVAPASAAPPEAQQPEVAKNAESPDQATTTVAGS